MQTIYKRMKIVVSTIGRKGKNEHLIQVVDRNNVVHSETTESIKQRDKVVWQLAEMYNILDIEVRHGKSTVEDILDTEFRFSEIPSIPVIDEEDAKLFFDDHEDLIFNRIIKAIEEGIVMDLEFIRLFELNGTGVYLTSEKNDWKNGIEKAIEYFISTEEYEKCVIGRQLLHKL